MAYYIGVTGGFGTGKSTVARFFASFGAHVIDADAIVHELLSCDGPVSRQIGEAFGRGVLAPDGSVDRRRLGRKVFEEPSRVRRLNRLIHPAVRVEMRLQMLTVRRRDPWAVIVYDVPLLIEGGLFRLMDCVVVVIAPEKVQIARAQRRTGLSPQAIRRRMRQQMPLSKKRRFADFVVDNGGPLRATRRQVQHIWEMVVRS